MGKVIFITKAVVGLDKAKRTEHPVGAQSVADTSYSAGPMLVAALSGMASLDSACTLAGPLPLAALSCLPSWSHTLWAVVLNKDSSTFGCLGALDSCVPFAAAELPAAEEGVGLSRKPRGPWSSSPLGRLPGVVAPREAGQFLRLRALDGQEQERSRACLPASPDSAARSC